MAYAIIWSGGALDDIDGLAEYIARDSIYHAQHVVTHIIECGDALNEYPNRGRILPELNDPLIREIFVYSYRVVYEIREDSHEVLILAVIHGKQLLGSSGRLGELE